MRRQSQTPSHRSLAAVLGLAAALALAACDSGGSKSAPAGSPATTNQSAVFPQAPCGTYSGDGCAPKAARVDLQRPSFSNPTRITNPLFPISRLQSVVLLGHVRGKPFRTETTLLPTTATVDIGGRRMRVLLSQYLAFVDRRIDEIALDRYAQADDGSVWYLGEDVMDYRKGAVVSTEGTWLAGREGPPAMIMPADPKVGDVFRAENSPGIVFEEVKVSSVGRILDGPRGPVKGGLVADELHPDKTIDHKIFAPGYGEFRTGGGGDLEALALAVPTDALPGPPPPQLQSLRIRAVGLLESARAEDWEGAAATLRHVTADWRALQSRRQPPRIAAVLTQALARLSRAVKAKQVAGAAQASVDVAQSALDLELRHRPETEIDAARFDLRTQQLRIDAAAKDLGAVTGDVAVLEWMRDRFVPTLSLAARQEIDGRLRALRAATDAENLPAAADHAARLGERVRVLAPLRPLG